MKAVIVGGGIGGLTAALCLHDVGWDVKVLEQSLASLDAGAGIQISPNGSKVLARLGLLEPMQDVCMAPASIEMRQGQSGHRIFAVPLAGTAELRWGAPYLHLHRADLIASLTSALNQRLPGALHVGCQVQSYQQDGAQIEITDSDGMRCSADLLIGADGIHSVIREQMLGPEQPRYTGNIAWRATVSMDRLSEHRPPPSACVWVGPGRHAVTYRLRSGTLANLVGVVEQNDWREESWTSQGSRAEALADFAGWHPVITTLLEQAEQHFRWALIDRPPLPRWSDGSVVLMGDACHAMLPFLAQGAVMAIEDAWVLSRVLAPWSDKVATPDCFDAPLAHYVEQRLQRTSKVQSRARQNSALFHARTRLSQFLLHTPLSLVAKLRPSLIQSRQDWLFGHDVTQ